MRRTLVALLFAGLLASPAMADMYQDASNAKLPESLDNIFEGIWRKQENFSGATGLTALLVTPSPNNNGGVFFTRQPATSSDGYDMKCHRDANYTGGVAGNVNKCLWVTTQTGAGAATYEWNAVFKMDNHASAGSSLALYVASVKYPGAGITWGSTEEIRDLNVDPTSGVITKEMDLWAFGTDANAQRYILDMFGGPVPGSTGATPVITSAIRIGATGGVLANATFSKAINFNTAGYGTLIGTSSSPTFNHGVDLSGGTCTVDCFASRGFAVNGAGDVTIATTTNGGGLSVSGNSNSVALRLFNTQTGGKQWMLQSTGGSSIQPSALILQEALATRNSMIINAAGDIGFGGNVTSVALAGAQLIVPATGGGVTMPSLPTSAGAGGLTVCVDSAGKLYKKAACP